METVGGSKSGCTSQKGLPMEGYDREEEAKLVLGGEVALWLEQANSIVLDARIWPRSFALAKTLWSGNMDEKGVKRYAEPTDSLYT
ncbi:hypothetical protein Fmac_028442 [Flemingia macrophylla]|uniref:beta-N-acetylhexosaminidase n=1 Tax=Flemingia macrophylla TaxID=520843 RepID=A0ABD1L7X9_9FABA